MRIVSLKHLIAISAAGLGVVCVAGSVRAATLVLHSSMDNADISAATVSDTAGTPQNGTLDANVAAGATGQIHQAIDSSATNGVGSVGYGNVLDVGAGSQTVCIWFNADTVKTMGLAQKGNGGSGNIGWNTFLESRNSGEFLRVAVRANATGVSDNANRAIAWTDLTAGTSTGVWHHVAFVLDATAGTVAGYLDGNLMTTTNSWGMTFTTDGNGVANSDSILVGTGFDGKLDDLAIYSGTLTAQQITTIYQNGLSGIAVPEPASLGLMACGGLMLVTRRRTTE